LLKAILARGDEFGVSYRIVECSSCRRSKARNEPSAPTETKMSALWGNHERSYTARSCAMSCVRAWPVLMSHSVAVVSVEHVTMLAGAVGFQLNDVMGGRL
jgi:hypothetical protein